MGLRFQILVHFVVDLFGDGGGDGGGEHIEGRGRVLG